MSTHIDAKQGDIAEVVLLPGDPLRAKFIAENFLANVTQYNTVRNMFGYTGTYQGVRVSVQGSGMGIPSLSIYATELIQDFGVKKIIRVGTAGGLLPELEIGDVLLAEGASTDSNVLQATFGQAISFAPLASFELLCQAHQSAKQLDIPVRVGNIFAADRFYNDEIDNHKLAQYGVMAVEMESAGLFLIGAKYHVQTLSILTVSDNLVTQKYADAKMRETAFQDMMRLALATAVVA